MMCQDEKDHKFYENFAHQVEREDGLVDSRLKTFLTFQGILFASLSFVGRGNIKEEIYDIMVLILPIGGMVSSFLAYLAIKSAINALSDLNSIIKFLTLEQTT